MSAVPQPAGNRLRLALDLAKAGYRIFPLKPNTKEPATRHGFKDATSDVTKVKAWWTEDPDYNIGLATGLQDNGMWVGVVDVDAKHGGVFAWKQLTKGRGNWQRTTPIHKTPRDGFHIFGQADPALGLTSANGFPEGIDTRGDGGYVVLPDSVFVDPETGAIGNYVCTENSLWSAEPIEFPVWVIELWQHRPEPVRAASTARHPSAQLANGLSPADWCRQNMNLQVLMEGVGWTQHGGPDHLGRIPMTRPGKSTGISANINPTGESAYIFTTEIPDHAKPFGRVGTDGMPNNYSAWDFLCGFVCKGDTTAAAKLIYSKMPPSSSAGRVQTTEAVPEASATALAIERMCLPEWFWQQRPWLTHVRDSAWAVGSVPEALLAAVLGRIATMCSPRWLIPAIVEDEATFDLITVIVGHSGTGKSGPMRRAKKVLPCSYPKLRFGLGISSGEGILEAYYGMVETENAEGKKSKERGKAYDGVHFTVDEGKLFTGLGDRNGWTGIDRILTAWSGGDLSTPNAKQENFRHIEAGTYRFALTLAIQADQASDLWSADNLTQGFTGRLTMLSGLSTTVPDRLHRPADPGPLKLALPPVGYPRILTYPEAFEVEVQDAHHAKRSLINDPDPLSGHRNLQRAKLAGTMALAEGRFDVEESDIALATAIVDASDVIRTWLMQRAVAVRVANDQAMAEARGRSTAVQQQATDKALLGDTVDFVGAKLRLRDMSRKELRGTLTRSKLDYLDSALQLLEDMGKVSGGRGAKWHWTG